jgi:hypothetical protein
MARPASYELKGSFGKFKGTKIYYHGFKKRPKFLPKNGRGFSGLKHLLETLEKQLGKFTLTFTVNENSLKKEKGKYKVKLSEKITKLIYSRRLETNRALNLRICGQLLKEIFPGKFDGTDGLYSYQKGMFAHILRESFDPRLLSADDRAALTKFVMGDKKDSKQIDVPTAYKTTRNFQLVYLTRLLDGFESELPKNHNEDWWQKYFSTNLLFFQDNYIRRLEKINITVAGTRFPDFAVVTSDGYLDVIEIKKPNTDLLKKDKSRHNFYWSIEIAKSISQVENYIDNIVKHGDSIRNAIRDDYGIDLRVIKPRGIVIAGMAASFSGNVKMADDFRRLNEGMKNLQIVPYDVLSQNIRNKVISIEKLSEGMKKKKSKRIRKTK